MQKYWENKYVAAVLDPSKKLPFVKYCFIKIYSSDKVSVMIKKMQKALEDLFDEYKMRLQTNSEDVGESSQVSEATKSTTEVPQKKKNSEVRV